jgi:hypothetical protein
MHRQILTENLRFSIPQRARNNQEQTGGENQQRCLIKP